MAEIKETPAPKVLLMGDSGTGKSTSLQSLVDLGITPFVVATEQNFMQVNKEFLGKTMHYKYIAGEQTSTVEGVIQMLTKINNLSYELLCKTFDPTKSAHNKLIEIPMTFNKFVCDCCGKDWGMVTKWNTDRAWVLDSFSGASEMAFSLVIGNKPVRDRPDYQVAQNALRSILSIAYNLRCMFVLITHLDKEPDPTTGAYILTVKTVGQKLGPDLPRSFSDCIRARRDGSKIVWDTADNQTTVVGRHVPMANNLAPDFKLLVSNWKNKGGKIEETKA